MLHTVLSFALLFINKETIARSETTEKLKNHWLPYRLSAACLIFDIQTQFKSFENVIL